MLDVPGYEEACPWLSGGVHIPAFFQPFSGTFIRLYEYVCMIPIFRLIVIFIMLLFATIFSTFCPRPS